MLMNTFWDSFSCYFGRRCHSMTRGIPALLTLQFLQKRHWQLSSITEARPEIKLKDRTGSNPAHSTFSKWWGAEVTPGWDLMSPFCWSCPSSLTTLQRPRPRPIKAVQQRRWSTMCLLSYFHFLGHFIQTFMVSCSHYWAKISFFTLLWGHHLLTSTLPIPGKGRHIFLP